MLRLEDGTLHPSCPVADVLRNELAVMNKIGVELGIGSNEFVTKRAEILRAALDIGWWELWLKGIATSWVSKPFAGWHYRLWQWAMAIEPGVRPSPLVVCAPRGSGKALPLDTPIPTPDGWTTMGELAVGDPVLGPNGCSTTVSAVTETMHHRVWRVTFDDGAEIIADSDHQWTVIDQAAEDREWAGRTNGKANKRARIRKWGPQWWAHPAARTMTTLDLVEAGLHYDDRPGHRARRWGIGLGVRDGAEADLPIDPYLFGYWLGDGDRNGARITVGDEDLGPLQVALFALDEPVSSTYTDPRTGAHTLQLGPGRRGPVAGRFRTRLRHLGVLGDKRIPAAYLTASIEQRKALLSGLADSDGSHASGASVEITQMKKDLADDIVELADGLGYKTTISASDAKLNGRVVGTRHRIRIRCQENPFRLERKAERWSAPKFGAARFIESIEPLEDPIDVRCITVDNDAELYQAGRRHIVTHNTAMLQLVTLALAARRTRNYAIYVGATQSAVEDKVAGIGELIQSEVMAQAYPEVSRIYTTNTGSRRDWRKSRIRTNSGFTLDAFGLDQAIRGARVDDDRPGFICADDIESQTDTAYMTQKRQDALTKAVLPSGSDDAAIVFIQNKIHQASLMAQLLDGTAEFMADRVAIGPIRQVDNLTYVEREPTPGDGRRYVITGGTPTWEGLDLKTSEQEMNDLGLSAFMTEKQQEDWEPEGNMFPSRYWRHDTTDPTRRRWLSMCRAWDLAGTEAKDADYTVGALMGIIDVNDELQVHVLHVERFQLEVAGVEQMVKHTAQLDRLDFGRHIPIVLEEQPGAAGKAWKRQWSKHLFGHSVWFVPPQGSKTIRAEPGASVLQQGLAYLNGGKWMNRFMRELGAFPTGRNDDQVDAYALGYNWMADRLGVNKKGSLHRRSAQVRVEHRAALPPAS